jgi:hypothetical protein
MKGLMRFISALAGVTLVSAANAPGWVRIDIFILPCQLRDGPF